MIAPLLLGDVVSRLWDELDFVMCEIFDGPFDGSHDDDWLTVDRLCRSLLLVLSCVIPENSRDMKFVEGVLSGREKLQSVAYLEPLVQKYGKIEEKPTT